MPRPLLYQAPQEPIADTKTGLISRAWYMWLMQLIQDFTTSGDVFGPGSSTDGQIVLFDGATGTQIKGATGTGVVHATAGIYSVSDVTLPEIVPATAGSLLIGRRSGSAGDWEEVTLGDGVSMSASAVLSATGTGGHLHGMMRTVGDGATTTFNLLDIAEYLEHVGVGGSFQDPLTFTLSVDGSQITFDTAPSAAAVIALEYVIAGV